MGGKNDVKVYDYCYALDYALCQGPIDSINYIWVKDKRVFCGSVRTRADLCIEAPELFGGDSAEGGVGGVIECYVGHDDQFSSPHLARRMGFDYQEPLTKDTSVEDRRNHWTKAPGYPRLAHLFFRRSGTARGGFKWGTNNPYLPGVKASVTYIPRKLSHLYAAVRPLNAVYDDGGIPDQQNPNSYDQGRPISDDSGATLNRHPVRFVTNNNAGYGALFLERIARAQAHERVVASDPVGICDATYLNTGFLAEVERRIIENGNVQTFMLPPALNISTGSAYFEIKMEAWTRWIGLLGHGYYGVFNVYAILQYAEDAEGNLGELLAVSQDQKNGDAVTMQAAVHPRCRFVKAALASSCEWIRNRVQVEHQSIELCYHEVSFTHCNMGENLGELPDANPSHIIYDLLIDEQERDSLNFEDYIKKPRFLAAAQTLFNEGFGLSIRQDETLNRQQLISEICKHINGAVYQDPQDGKWDIALFRKDYNPDTLPIITRDQCRIINGGRRAYSECISEITVEYTDPNEEKTASVSAHNTTASNITGNRVPEVRSYQFVRNSALAQLLADRDVIEASYPLWIGTLEMDRSFWNYTPGRTFKLNYIDDDFQIETMILRVTNVEFGELTDRKIRVEVIEDIYGIEHTQYRPPQRPITEVNDLPLRARRPQYMVPFTVPYALLERRGVLDNITDDHQTHKAVLFGSVDFRLDNISIYHRTYSTGNNGVQELAYTVSPTPMQRLEMNLNVEVESRIPQSMIETVFPAGATPGTLIMITPGTSTDDGNYDPDHMEKVSEIVELAEFDATTAEWIVKRGVFDTVPRQWVFNSLIWDISDAVDNAQLSDYTEEEIDDLDTNTWPYYGRVRSGMITTADASLWQVPISRYARNHKPTRPANVQVNGFGPDPLIDTSINSDITELVITWSTRNKTTDEANVPWWNDGNFAPEAGEIYTVRFIDPDSGVIRYEETGITGTTITRPVSDIAPRGVVYVEVFAVDSLGRESFMASQNWVQIDKVARDYQGWNYQWGRNWGGAHII